jgi:hypothetical protein
VQFGFLNLDLRAHTDSVTSLCPFSTGLESDRAWYVYSVITEAEREREREREREIRCEEKTLPERKKKDFRASEIFGFECSLDF